MFFGFTAFYFSFFFFILINESAQKLKVNQYIYVKH